MEGADSETVEALGFASVPQWESFEYTPAVFVRVANAGLRIAIRAGMPILEIQLRPLGKSSRGEE